jgi:pimeloyl-ACP methyl ester carboxylesterase
MQEHKILVKELETHYKTIGEGKPLLVLHGWGSNSEKWVKVAELLAKDQVMAIIPDLPGFGLSKEPQTAWNLDNYNDWLYEFVQKVPELQKQFCLLGHSFGGALAVKFSIKYNQYVNQLFLVAAACIRKRTRIKKAWYAVAKIGKLFSFLPYYKQARKGFYKFILRKSDYPHVTGIMKETYLKVVLEDLSFRLRFVKVPTALIWGDKDDLTPLDQAHFIHSKISHSKLIIIPGGVHGLQIKTPEILAEKIGESLPFIAQKGEILSLKNII